jgi:hypothetical protein
VPSTDVLHGEIPAKTNHIVREGEGQRPRTVSDSAEGGGAAAAAAAAAAAEEEEEEEEAVAGLASPRLRGQGRTARTGPVRESTRRLAGPRWIPSQPSTLRGSRPPRTDSPALRASSSRSAERHPAKRGGRVINRATKVSAAGTLSAGVRRGG